MRLLAAALLVTSLRCVAQQPSTSPSPTDSQNQQQNAAEVEPAMVTVPAGTKILLELRHTISTKDARPGDTIYLQTIAPVVADDKTMIPVGSYLQGTLDSVDKHASGRGPALRLHLASLTLANGYTVGIPGNVEFGANRQYTYYERPEIHGVSLAIMAGAPIAGTLIGGFAAGRGSSPSVLVTPTPPPFPILAPAPPLAPLPSVRPNFSAKGAGIGLGVGAAVALTTLLIELNQRNVVMEAGLSSEMTLEEPLQLRADRVQDAVLHYNPPVIIHTPPIVIHDNLPRNDTSSNRCSAGETKCGSNCCGPFETCHGGICKSNRDECSPGKTMCEGRCVSAFFNSNSNCGSCGNSCGIGETCRGGTCQRTFPCRRGEIGCH